MRANADALVPSTGQFKHNTAFFHAAPSGTAYDAAQPN
jgi:hypothetical protein